MPLQTTAEPGRYNASTDDIYFFMVDGQKRVTCSVTEQALLELDDRMIRTAQGRLDVFYRHRDVIEGIASRQYDQCKFEPDGRTVLIRAADLGAGSVNLSRTITGLTY